MYSPEAMNHFLKPRNIGALSSPDGRGEATNHACGDTATFTVSVRDGRIADIRFASEACAGGIAACSATTEWAAGKAMADVDGFDAAALSALLGGLPDAKFGCAEMAVNALQAATSDAKSGGNAG